MIARNRLKNLAGLLLVLIPVAGLAAGYGGAEGRNRSGEIIHIGSDSYYELLVQRNKDDHEWAERYDMNIECPGFAKAMATDARVFSCSASRRFPLAGATYRITASEDYQPCNLDPYFDQTPGTIYECIAGCDGRRVPKRLVESPWEC